MRSDGAERRATGRRRRSNGDASRERILDAAAEIAAERGYDGTSINLVSERSGLPASSIYWHFTNKDELIAAVIERSFRVWMSHVEMPTPTADGATVAESLHASLQHTGAALRESNDFLRLGLMLILERRPAEVSARRRFLELRQLTHDSATRMYGLLFPDLDLDAHRELATLTIACADGILVAHEIDPVDMPRAFDLLAAAVLGAAQHLRATPRRRR